MKPISEVSTPILGGTPKRSVSQYWGGPVKWASAKDIASTGNRYIYQTSETITSEGVRNSAAKILPKGTIIITARGTVGALVQLGSDMAFNQTCYGLITKKGVLSDYLFYALKGSLQQMHTLTYGTVFETITKKTFDHWIIPMPSPSEQRAIAHILGTLDDKIELNRQMNATLESMAQAMFKSWFVDFDPVIDNALAAGNPIPEPLKARAENRKRLGDQRKPLPQEIQQQFPDRFVFTEELGWVPEGWEIGKLSDIAELKTQSVKPDKKPDKMWVHFSIPAFDENKTPHKDIGQSIKSGKYRVPKTAVLASKLNPQFPRVWLPEVEDEDSSVCSTEFMPFIPLNAEERSYLYTFFCSEKIQVEIANRVTGSTGSRQRVKPKEIAEMTILKVPQSIRADFSKRASSILSKQANSINEQTLLTNLRDTLLPKLISGQLRLSDSLIDKFAEQVNSPEVEQITSEAI